MKFAILLATLFISQLSFAQSLAQKEIKKDMLERTNSLIEKVDGAREDLYREDLESACKRIKEIFALYPDHMTALGMRLHPAYSSVSADALKHLTLAHKSTLLCDSGEKHEHVDSKMLRHQLKATLKSLKKQRKIIRKEDTSYNNRFEYEYEF